MSRSSVHRCLAACVAILASLSAGTARADDAARWLGAWIGDVSSPFAAQVPLPVHIVVKPGAATPVVEVTCVRAGAIAKPALHVLANESTLAFTLDAGGRRARFEGEPVEDGRAIAGNFHFLDDAGALVPPAQRWSMRRVDIATELASARTYGATLDLGGQGLAMQIALGEGPHGWCGAIEVAAQGLRNFPMTVARAANGFVIGVPLEPAVTMVLNPSDDGSQLAGTFAQGPFTAPVVFVEMPGVRLAGSRRPQDPQPPFPYAENEVRIDHAAGHRLAGTLSVPASSPLARDGRAPALLLVSGSGPQDRDGSIFGHRPFAVLADAFARAGFVVLRCDDRGVGGSSGEFARAAMPDFASDADLALEWLKTQPGVDPARVGIVGHSEGGIVAPLVALWQSSDPNPLAFTVLLAPPATPGGVLLNRQSKALYDAARLPEATSGPIVAAHAALMRAVERHAPPNELRPLVVELVKLQIGAGGQPLPPEESLQATYDGVLAQVTTPWMSESIRYDPRPALSRLRAPTLAMCGTKDLQVDAAENLGVIDALAKSGVPAVTRRCEGLNHLFQPAQAGVPDEYATIDTTFDPTTIAEIVAWMTDIAKRAPAAQPAGGAASAVGDEASIPRRLYRLVPPKRDAEAAR